MRSRVVTLVVLVSALAMVVAVGNMQFAYGAASCPNKSKTCTGTDGLSGCEPISSFVEQTYSAEYDYTCAQCVAGPDMINKSVCAISNPSYSESTSKCGNWKFGYKTNGSCPSSCGIMGLQKCGGKVASGC